MKELAIVFENDNGASLYEQIYLYIKNEIIEGKLKCEDKLPSTRGLATHLRVSRSTIIMAYDQLESEGYIYSKKNSGYYVCDVNELYNIQLNKQVKIQEYEKNKEYEYDFTPGGVELSVFPVNIWRKLTKNVLNDENRELFNRGDSRGDHGFRDSIMNYLHHSRGVNCSAENIVIGAGNDYLLLILLQILGDNCSYAMEKYTYVKSTKIINSLQKKIIAVAMDKEGIMIDELEKSGANVAYVMPSHQYPTGVVMPVKRRNELLKWAAKKPDRYIIEDDYDSEFRYRGRPIPSLQSQDSLGKVIYIGTFSKAIAPAIRMSYMVLPDQLMKCYQEHINFYSCSVSRIDQRIVDAFLSEGHYERHLNRMRGIYKEKHDMLMELMKSFTKAFDITGDYSGTHILLTSKQKMTDKELADKARQYGVKVYPMSEFYIGGEHEICHTVIIGYASMSRKNMIKGIDILKKVWL